MRQLFDADFLKRRRSDVRRYADAWLPIMMLVLAIGVASLVGTAHWISHPNVAWETRVGGAVYEVGQAYLLNMAGEPGASEAAASAPAPTLYTVGRLCAVMLAALVAFRAIALLIEEPLKRLKLARLRGHAVIGGLGPIGLQLADALRSRGGRAHVVGLDEQITEWHQRRLRRLGAIVLDGSVDDEEVLRRAGIATARKLFAVTDDDNANIEMLVDAQQLLTDSGRVGAKLRCYAHITDESLEEAIRRRFESNTDSPIEVRTFNAFDLAAKRVLIDHLIRRRPTERDETALYVLFGFDKMGRSLAFHLAQLAHFENRRRARLLILTTDAAKRADAFLSRFERFSPRDVAADVSTVRFEPDRDAWDCKDGRPAEAYQIRDGRAIEYACNAVFAELPAAASDAQLTAKLAQLINEAKVKPALVFCHDDDRRNFVEATAVRDALAGGYAIRDVPLLAYLPAHDALADVLSPPHSRIQTTAPVFQDVIPFGNYRDVISLDEVERSTTEALAIAIKADYDKVVDEKRARANFYADPPVFRTSNRMAADHAFVKLSCFGFRLLRPGETLLDGEELVDLRAIDRPRDVSAEMEHYRWVAERLLAGWCWAEQDSKTPPRRWKICTWEELGKRHTGADWTENEQHKDYAQFQCICRTLADLGFRLAKRLRT